MIKHRDNEVVIVSNLKRYLSTEQRPCEVIRMNQTAKAPPYPYVSYTATSPLPAHRGTYSKADDGTLYKNIEQTWSFTVQSDDQDESLALAMRIHDFFTAVGLNVLSDNGIAVLRVQGVSVRDTMLTIQYEYRNGLDVTFSLMYEIAPYEGKDVIETMSFKEV